MIVNKIELVGIINLKKINFFNCIMYLNLFFIVSIENCLNIIL